MKWITRILIVVIVIAGAGYIFREQIILELAGIAAKRRYNIAPHQKVDWKQTRWRSGFRSGQSTDRSSKMRKRN